MTLLGAITDEESDLLARHAAGTLKLRLVMLAMMAALLAYNLGLVAGLCWAAGMLAAEGWNHLAQHRGPWTRRRPGLWRLVRLSGMFLMGVAWASMAALYWFAGDPALQWIALILLTTLLMVALSEASTSAHFAVLFAAAPAFGLLVLPTFLGPHTGGHAVSIALVVAFALLYLVGGTTEAVTSSRALRRAHAQLSEQEAELKAQTQAAHEANAAKSRFLAVMSHELRTPMNGVLGMARALAETPLDPDQQRKLDMVLQSGDGLMAILNDLLDLSKAEAGKLDLECAPLDLTALGRSVCDLWAETARGKGVELRFAPELGGPCWVTGDAMRLRQLMNNLLSNALKFTAVGHVELRMRVLEADDGAARFEVAVSDTGVGLSPEQAARLFTPFSQADSSTARRFGGTGLGLSICQQLVTLMDGAIELRSQLGEGATVRVTLPLPAAAPAPDTEDTAEEALAQNLRVLVVDDNPINLAVAETLLVSVGAAVSTADNGAAALEALRASTFDVVLMDVHMPVMSGPEALRAIRAGEAGSRAVPVIALTADAMTGVDNELMRRGFDAVQAKPIHPAHLFQAIAEVTQVRASPSALTG